MSRFRIRFCYRLSTHSHFHESNNKRNGLLRNRFSIILSFLREGDFPLPPRSLAQYRQGSFRKIIDHLMDKIYATLFIQSYPRFSTNFRR
jgi:hypothetical protein